MSTVEVYAFNTKGDAFLYGEVGNAWAGAMAIWSILENKYLPQYVPVFAKNMPWYHKDVSPEIIQKKLGYLPSRLFVSVYDVNKDPKKEIWNLGQDENVLLADRITLYTTYDSALVKKENLQRVIDAFLNFEGITNLEGQATILRHALKDPNVIAIGWNQNSVCADNWENKGEPDPLTGEATPYNCLTGNEHFWIFDEIM